MKRSNDTTIAALPRVMPLGDRTTCLRRTTRSRALEPAPRIAQSLRTHEPEIIRRNARTTREATQT
eukprot:3838626-Pleurochrysis_carterae.AAC.3